MGCCLVGVIAAICTLPAAAATIEVVVDNRDPNTYYVGRWRISGQASSPWGADALYNNEGNDSEFFRWLPQVPEAANYEVFAWWQKDTTSNAAARYTIVHENGSDTVTVDQTDASLAARWVSLGTYTFSPGNDHFVQLSNENGITSADAIRLVAGTPHNTIDNQDTAVSTTGSWTSSTSGGPWLGEAVVNDGSSGAATFRWSPAVAESGTYEVFAWWPYASNQSASVPYRINHASGITTVAVDQSDPAQASQWVSLGSYDFTGGSTAYVEVSSENGPAAADAVQLRRVDTEHPSVQITQPVAKFVVLSGNTLTLQATAQDPQDGDLSSSIVWTSDVDGTLGSGATLGVSTLSTGIHLITASITDSDSNATARSVTAAIALPSPGTVEVVVDNNDANTSHTGTWSDSTGDSSWANNSVYHDGSGGSAQTFRWEPEVPSAGTYSVYAWWPHNSGHSSNVPYTVVHDGGQDIVQVNQQDAALGAQWNLLGSYAFTPGAGHYIEVSSANGQAAADAIRLLTGTVPVVVDNADSSTGEINHWSLQTREFAWGGVVQVGKEDKPRRFRWPVSPPKPGTYEVYAWWNSFSVAADNVPIRVYHAGGVATQLLDQNDWRLRGQWNPLGTYDFLADGSEFIEMSNENGYAVADAIRLVQVATGPGNQPPTANAGPDIQALAGATVQLDGAGSQDAEGPLSYAWAVVSGQPTPVLSDPNVVNPTIASQDQGANLSWVLQLTVTDAAGATDSDTVQVTLYSMGDDSDGDQLPDGWEFDYFLDITAQSGEGDPDNDGLTNLDEYQQGTDPTVPEAVDTDADGVLNHLDNCPGTPPTESVDANGCSASQRDSDGDGYADNEDAFPGDPTEWSDIDFDGIGDNSDPDRDGDGVDNGQDMFPDDPSESVDSDGDGIGDFSDPDRDGDNVANESDPYPDDPTRSSLPILTIDSPPSLVTVGSTPIGVSGQLDPSAVSLTINGVNVASGDGTFSAIVPLEEGHNTISARMVMPDGETTTASISVSLDLTPPYITVESHENNQVVHTETITVTGLVNDIVRGTVEQSQAVVDVNGSSATISNRSYMATGIGLAPGPNTVTVQAQDQVGNVASTSFNVIFEPLGGKKIALVDGDNQGASINDFLPQPLTVRVTDSQGAPVDNAEVLFRVIQGAGLITAGAEESTAIRAVTSTDGLAAVNFRVGPRVGVGNHKVRAQVVGYENEVIFTASAVGLPGNKISVNSGNNQRSGVHQMLPQPLTVVVTDAGANVVANAVVQFKVLKGGGYFFEGESPETSRPQSVQVQTDSDGRASVSWVLGGLEGFDQQRAEAILLSADPLNTSGVARAGFSATGFVTGDPGSTSISGMVEDNLGNPLVGVTISTSSEPVRQAVTDEQGYFQITEAPVGPVHLEIDGSTIAGPGEYPTLTTNLVTVSGVDNPLPAPMYLVKLNTDNAVEVGAEDAVLTFEEYPGFKLEIEAGSVTFPDGSNKGLLSVTSVNANKVPMPPPNGMQPQFIVTIQPAGTRFDPPARLTLPNVDGHSPGAQVEMYSFDHDLEEFVAIGLGTVSNDGTLVESNPGVGVIKAGWHCGSQPGGSGCGHNCGTCFLCTGACNCESDPLQDFFPKPQSQQVYGDCKTKLCNGSQAADDNDILAEDLACKECVGGSLRNKEDSLEPMPPELEGIPSVQEVPIVYKEDGTGGGTSIWGANNSPGYTSSLSCKPEPVCSNGEQKYQLVGTLVLAEDWQVVVSTEVHHGNCSIGQRTRQNIDRTRAHEERHRDLYLDVLYDALPNSTDLYTSLAECENDLNRIGLTVATEWEIVSNRQDTHADFSGDPRWASICDNGVAKEIQCGTNGVNCACETDPTKACNTY